MSAEVKAFKDQAAEAQRHAKLSARRDKLRKIEMLWRLWHAEKQVDEVRRDMELERGKKNGTAAGEEENGGGGGLALAEAELKKAKKEYAKINKQVLLSEKMAKEKERERLDLVCVCDSVYSTLTCIFPLRNPHCTRAKNLCTICRKNSQVQRKTLWMLKRPSRNRKRICLP